MNLKFASGLKVAKALGYTGPETHADIVKFLSQSDATVQTPKGDVLAKALTIQQPDSKTVVVAEVDEATEMSEDSMKSIKKAGKTYTAEEVDNLVRTRIDDALASIRKDARPTGVEVSGGESAEYAAYNAKPDRTRVFKSAKEADLFISGLTLAGSLGNTFKNNDVKDRALVTLKRFMPDLAKDYTSGVGSVDALMVPVFGTDVIRLFNSFGKMASVANVVTMTDSNEFTRIRNLTETIAVSYPPEVTQVTSTDADLRLYTARTKQAMLRSVVSLTALRYSRLSLADEIARTFANSFQRAEDNAAINGDGTSSFGGIVGLDTQFRALGLNNTGGRVLGGGNWAAYTRAVFETALSRAPAYANEAGLYWACCNAFFEGVMKPIARAAGGNAVDDISNWSGNGAKFLGRPVILSEVINSNADTGTSTIDCYLGNFNLGLDLIRSSGMEIETDLSSGFNTATANIRGLLYHGAQCAHGVGTASAAGPIVALYQN